MSERLDHLDGLRGVAALSVVAFHMMLALTPSLVPEQQSDAFWLAYSPLAVIWNGTFAVSVFFVLSGFVFTNATLRRSDPIWVDIAIRHRGGLLYQVAETLFVHGYMRSDLLIKALSGHIGKVLGSISFPAYAAEKWLERPFLVALGKLRRHLRKMRPHKRLLPKSA